MYGTLQRATKLKITKKIKQQQQSNKSTVIFAFFLLKGHKSWVFSKNTEK